MQINIQQEFHNSPNKLSLVFPTVIGTRKHLLPLTQQILQSPKSSIQINDNLHIKQDKLKFLSRMRKAKDLILNFRKKNHKLNIKNDEDLTFQFPRSKTQQVQGIKLKVNIQRLNNNMKKQDSVSLLSAKIKKKQSFGNQLYNDNYLRKTKSKNIYHENIQVKSNNRNKFYLLKSSKYNQNKKDQYMLTQIQKSQREYRKLQTGQKLLMNLDLSCQLINENGSKLVQKLIQCRTTKNKDNQNRQKKLFRFPLANPEKQQQCKSVSKQKINIKSVQNSQLIRQVSNSLSSFRKKSLHKLKIQFHYQRNLQNKKQKFRLTFRKAKQMLNEEKARQMESSEKNSNYQKRQSKLSKKYRESDYYKRKQVNDEANIQNKGEGQQDLNNSNNLIKNSVNLKHTKQKSHSNFIKLKLPHYDETDHTNYKIQGWNVD